MDGRSSSNPIDKVCAMALPFQKLGSHNFDNVTLPIYNSSTSVSAAWAQLMSSTMSSQMNALNLHSTLELPSCKKLQQVMQTPTIQLLCLFPHPSRHHWFPSWTQVQQYPNVSVRDNDSILLAEDMDCALHIKSGRIYRGCTLRLIQRPSTETKAVYCAAMDGKYAHLVATVPGIKPNINSRTKYVLVDISPDCTLLPSSASALCTNTRVGHEHLPIWEKSVVIICEEVDTIPQPAADITAILRYRLRRVTTLEWDCRPAAESLLSALRNCWPWSESGCWLPFKPSLVHIRSVFCSAKGRSASEALLGPPECGCALDAFYDPVAAAGRLSQDGWEEEWTTRLQLYEVYLV